MQDIEGEVLCVSQFTLLASTKKGNKPDFHGALGGDEARELYQYFFDQVQKGYSADRVKNGVFQAMMEVALVNDGPVRLFFLPVSNMMADKISLQVTLELTAGSQHKADKPPMVTSEQRKS